MVLTRLSGTMASENKPGLKFVTTEIIRLQSGHIFRPLETSFAVIDRLKFEVELATQCRAHRKLFEWVFEPH